MTYYEAALQILRFARHPLTTREITDQALERGLITASSKTPVKSMEATLYTRARNDPKLIKIEDPGNGQAKKGSVHWALRQTTTTIPEPRT
jgi:hypothetical protein